MIRLEELRKQKGLSQQQVADFLQITQQAYSHYEKGRREPDYNTLIKISDFYEASIDWILRKTDNPTPQDKKNDWVPYDKFKSSFFEGYDTLNEEGRKEIENYMNYLIQKQKETK